MAEAEMHKLLLAVCFSVLGMAPGKSNSQEK